MKRIIVSTLAAILIVPAQAFAAPIVINETGPGCELKGVWAPSGNYSTQGCVGNDYHYTSKYAPYKKTGKEKAIFTPNLPSAGKYKVEVSWRGTENRSGSVTYEVVHKGGSFKKTISQKTSGASWATLGVFEFDAGKAGHVAMISDGGGSASVDAARFTLGGSADATAPGSSSTMDDVLGGGGSKPAGAEAISLDAGSAGTKAFTFEKDGTASVTPYLETYGPAKISVKIKKASGEEVEWMKWERKDDKDPSPLNVDGKPVGESMNENAGDPSPAPATAYEYKAARGDVFTLSLSGKFGKASPFLKMSVK